MSTDELKKTPGANGFIRTLSILAAAAVVALVVISARRRHGRRVGAARLVRPHDDGHEYLLDLRLRLHAGEPLVAQAALSARRLDHATDRRLAGFFIRGKDVMSNLNSLYARLGGEEGVIRLVKAYIEALKTLPGAQRLRSLYPEDLSKYELRMTEFLSTWLGGPALYQERHGMPMLRESHRSFAIDGEARDEWMLCMRTALRETVSDEELRLYLEGAFWRMADSLRTK